MDLPWDITLTTKDQTRYSPVTKLKYDTILEKYNNWVIMNFIDKGTD